MVVWFKWKMNLKTMGDWKTAVALCPALGTTASWWTLRP
jgi:hypothetical protein